MEESHTKLLIIGAGPGGYVAGIRAGQLGIETTIVEAEAVGGVCLSVGCIPSKALIHAADEFERAAHFTDANPLGIVSGAPRINLAKTIAWKDGIVERLTGGVGALLRKSKVRRVQGWARFLDGKTVIVRRADGNEEKITAENVIVATGSEPVELPDLPFGGAVVSSTEALSLQEPPRSLVVVGAGYIGLELGMAFRKLGSAVSVVEAGARILPAWDAELTRPVANRLKSLGVAVYLGAMARELNADGDLVIENADGAQQTLHADKVLVAVGRRPVTEGWGREELALDMAGPFIKIDDECKTAMRGVYAIGDVTGEPMLAHRAMAQGEMVAEIIAGERRRWDKAVVPAICFTDPEIVSVGRAPVDVDTNEFETALFPFAANGRAMTMEAEEGFVRVVARRDNHVVVGMQAVGRGVAELSSTFALAIEMGARLEDVAATIHAHPTQGEAVQEAAMRALGHALHI